MVALETPEAKIGWKAPDFDLPATDGLRYTRDTLTQKKGLLVAFICNHCPYVLKQVRRIVDTAYELEKMGFGVVAISSNDANEYPEDSFEEMKIFAQQHEFCFPYLYDESQQVAKAYGAVCTPDFFGFNGELELQYRGRLDAAWSGLVENPQREMLEAMQEIADTGKTTKPQNPSIGCSIKWRIGPTNQQAS